MCHENKKVKTFYWYFRPIALSAKLFGVLPLQNLHHSTGSKIAFQYISIAHIYSTFIFFNVISLFYYYSQWNFASDDDDAIIWKLIVVHVIIVRSSICFLFCVHHSKTLPNLIKMLDLFDKKKSYMLNLKESTLKKFFVRSVLPFFNGAFYMVVSFFELRMFITQVISPEIRDEEQGKNAALMFGILGDWQVLPLLLYVYFAYTITSNFKDISAALAGYATIENICNENAEFDPNLSKMMPNIRSLHTLMSAAVNHLSDSFGSFLAVDQFCINVMFVVNLYVYFFISNYLDFHLLLCTAINALLVLTVILASHQVKETGAKVMQSLQCIHLSSVDEQCQREIQLFMSQIASNPIQISAAGYFVMDRNQIPSILSSVATYFIALVQFASQSKRLDCNNNQNDSSIS